MIMRRNKKEERKGEKCCKDAMEEPPRGPRDLLFRVSSGLFSVNHQLPSAINCTLSIVFLFLSHSLSLT